MKFLVLAAFLPSLVFAAPPADSKLVDVWSRMDEFHAARGIQKAASPFPLKRVEGGLEGVIDRFLDSERITGLLVLKGDTVLAERYQYGRTAQHRFASASVAKTVLGMLVGIAVQEKKISSLDDKVGQYIPALNDHPYGETSIRDLLTMSSGIVFKETYTGRDEGVRLVDNTLRQKTEGGADTVLEFRQRAAPPGKHFNYSSADSQVLGLVLRAAVGVPLATYLSEKIWQPMGAEANATWLVDKGGYETGYCCINATLRDYARFGMLLANHGSLDGRQIIPAEWVKAATTASAPHLQIGTATANNGYGFQTWLIDRDEPRFAALGIYGQGIFVDPATKLVVVYTGAWASATDRPARGAQFRLWNSLLTRLSQRYQQ